MPLESGGSGCSRHELCRTRGGKVSFTGQLLLGSYYLMDAQKTAQIIAKTHLTKISSSVFWLVLMVVPAVSGYSSAYFLVRGRYGLAHAGEERVGSARGSDAGTMCCVTASATGCV